MWKGQVSRAMEGRGSGGGANGTAGFVGGIAGGGLEACLN